MTSNLDYLVDLTMRLYQQAFSFKFTNRIYINKVKHVFFLIMGLCDNFLVEYCCYVDIFLDDSA